MKTKFPFFQHYKSIYYFDSAATTIKPNQVIDAISHGYMCYTIPCERSKYALAYNCYDKVVLELRKELDCLFFLENDYHIVFSHSVTIILEKLLCLLKKKLFLDKEVEIALPNTVHSSFLEAVNLFFSKFKLNFFDFDIKALNSVIDILYVPYVDHVSGYKINFHDLVEYKNDNKDVFIIIDASQGLSLYCPRLGGQQIDCIIGTSHKMYGPDGVAWIAIHKKHDFVFGWNGILSANKDFRVGSLSYAGMHGYISALSFLKEYIYNNQLHYQKMGTFFYKIISFLQQYNHIITLISPLQYYYPIISFSHKTMNAHDIAEFLDSYNVCVRSGEICAPHLCYPNGIVRISLACYNTEEDIDKIITILKVFFNQ